MSINKPLILVSNDDGFDAVGICSLVEMIGDMGEIIVCAPDSARSGFSRAFSATVPLRMTRRHNMGEVEVWSTNGTPVDCVKLAVDELCGGRTPDLVIGGINHGDNSTVNNHYSGTMGVAVEGCIKGIPSVAFSNCDYNSQSSQTHLTHYVRRVVERVLAEGLPKGVCLNVNFPDRKTFEGIRACRMTFGEWVNEVAPQRHPLGYPYYWMVGHYRNAEPDAQDTDQWALAHGYVAVTPTTIDVTAYQMIDTVNNWKL